MADRIPEGWRECKIENLAKRITSGGTPLTKVKEYYGGEIPWLNTKEISFNRITDTEVKITKLGLNNSSAKWIDPNSVIVAMYGATAGKIAINKIPLTTNQACCNLTIDETIADYNFVYYCLRNSYDELENLASGAAQQNLNVGIISDFEILLPSLPEQHAIASVLSSLDDKIDLLNRENHTLEQMAEALFRQWFIEEADEKWEEGTIANMIDILPGFPFKSDLFTELGKYCLITIKSVQDGHLDISKTDKINDIPSRMPNYCYLKPGDILLSLTGNVGRCCLVDVNNALLNQRVAKLFAKNSRDMAYTYIYFRMEKTKRLLEEMAKGTAQPNLSPVETLRIKMRIPPKSKLELFSSKSNPIIKRILCNKMQIRTLEKLRDTLLPKLMSREVRVKL